jgi:hypothetical protein
VFALLHTFPYKDARVEEYTNEKKALQLVGRFIRIIEGISPGITRETEQSCPGIMETLVAGVQRTAEEFTTRKHENPFSHPLKGFGIGNIPLPDYAEVEPRQAVLNYKKAHGLKPSSKLYAMHEQLKNSGSFKKGG